MKIGSRKRANPFVLFVFSVLLFRFLIYFWYNKAPSRQFISDTVRRSILGDSTRLVGLLAVYIIVCGLRRTAVRKGQLTLFCLFCHSMGKANELIASWYINISFLTMFGILLTGYYGALLIDSMHSKSWPPKRWTFFAFFSITTFTIISAFRGRCSIVVFVACCIAKKLFFPSQKLHIKWGHQLAKTILQVLLLIFLASVFSQGILFISRLLHTSSIVNSTLLDSLITGSVIIVWNMKHAEIIRVDSGDGFRHSFHQSRREQ